MKMKIPITIPAIPPELSVGAPVADSSEEVEVVVEESVG